jgi:hypothetical protein
MAYTCDIHWKYHVFVVFRCFRQNRKTGGAMQMYLPCIIVYFGCIRGLDDVLTSNTSKYIQYIRPAKSGCIGKIWMYCVCIEDVLDVLDVFKVVFGMYCVSISNVLEFRINCLFMVIALMIAGILTGFHHWRMYWNHQCQQIQHKYILNTFLITVPIHPKPLKNMHNTDSMHLHYIQATISTSSA